MTTTQPPLPDAGTSVPCGPGRATRGIFHADDGAVYDICNRDDLGPGVIEAFAVRTGTQYLSTHHRVYRAARSVWRRQTTGRGGRVFGLRSILFLDTGESVDTAHGGLTMIRGVWVS